MKTVRSSVWSGYAAAAVLLALECVPGTARAQGCMPLRFTSPNLGGQATSFLRPHEWQVGIGLRRVATHRFYVGSEETEAAAPGGQPMRLRLNSLNLSAAYGLSERTSLTLAVPMSASSSSNFHPDGERHSTSAAGIGDISLTAGYWLAQPTRHPFTNAQVSLGLKAPTGSVHQTDEAFAADGSSSQKPVVQTLQPGDGGFSAILQLQAFQRLAPRLSLYQVGSYSASLKKHTDVVDPAAGTELAVPDLYTGRLGLAWAALPDHGLSLSLGGRIDGTTSADLIGGHDDYARKAGYTLYVDPGLSWVTGVNQFTLSVPVRVRHDYLPMTLSNGTVRKGGGGVNDFVIYFDFSRRM